MKNITTDLETVLYKLRHRHDISSIYPLNYYEMGISEKHPWFFAINNFAYYLSL